MMTINAHISLDSLHCHRKGRSSGWRKTAPYMWNIFFRLCNPFMRANEHFRLQGRADFQFTKGSHGNLGVGHVDAGESIDIPKSIGQWGGELNDIDIPFFDYAYPGIVGCISILMEQRNVSRKGAEGGHKALNDYVRKSMNQAITDFSVKSIDVNRIEESITQYIDGEINKFTDGIERRVGGAVMQSQSLLQNIWSVLDRDALIGYQIWHFNQEDLRRADGQIPLSARWASYDHGDWEVKGVLTGK